MSFVLVPGMMVTCSLSGDARVWNSKGVFHQPCLLFCDYFCGYFCSDLTLGSPSMVFERQLKAVGRSAILFLIFSFLFSYSQFSFSE